MRPIELVQLHGSGVRHLQPWLLSMGYACGVGASFGHDSYASLAYCVQATSASNAPMSSSGSCLLLARSALYSSSSVRKARVSALAFPSFSLRCTHSVQRCLCFPSDLRTRSLLCA